MKCYKWKWLWQETYDRILRTKSYDREMLRQEKCYEWNAMTGKCYEWNAMTGKCYDRKKNATTGKCYEWNATTGKCCDKENTTTGNATNEMPQQENATNEMLWQGNAATGKALQPENATNEMLRQGNATTGECESYDRTCYRQTRYDGTRCLTELLPEHANDRTAMTGTRWQQKPLWQKLLC